MTLLNKGERTCLLTAFLTNILDWFHSNWYALIRVLISLSVLQ